MSQFQQVNPGLSGSGQRRRSIAQRWLNELMVTQLASYRDGDPVEVVDLGGGTGGIAARLAEAGHRVLVVDPSPDALAATERRAAELGLGDRLRARQGDSTNLTEVVPTRSADVVLCHLVLDRRADVAPALRAIAGVLVPGGLVSIVIAQRFPKLLKQAATGDFAAARALLEDTEMLDRAALTEALTATGYRLLAEHGIGAVSDHVPEAVVGGRADELLQLEADIARLPEHLESATRLHVLAVRD